jgi:MFS family permease
VAAALLGGNLARRFGTKRVYLAGLVADLVSMVLLVVSQLFTDDQTVAWGLLLAATVSTPRASRWRTSPSHSAQPTRQPEACCSTSGVNGLLGRLSLCAEQAGLLRALDRLAAG